MKTENEKIGGSLELPLWLLLTFCPKGFGSNCGRLMNLRLGLRAMQGFNRPIRCRTFRLPWISGELFTPLLRYVVVLIWFLCRGHEVANRRQISNMNDDHASVEILKKRHRRIANLAIKENKEGNETIISFPGFSLTSFTRAGITSAHAIAKWSDIYLIAFDGLVLHYMSHRETLLVLVASTFKITPSFHQRARLVFPMTVHTRLVHVGHSSFTFEGVTKDAESGDYLISNKGVCVVVNRKTGRSQPIKADVRENMETYLLKGMNRKPELLEVQNIENRPKTSFTYSIRVRHSDTDHNAIMPFKGQSAPGDELLTYIWNDERMPYVLFGVIEKESTVIWEGCVKFMKVVDK